MRLGQLQNRDSPGPLLPALKRLRINDPDEWSMSQLPLFFTPSLRSLEATNIPENQQSVLLSFLITLVDESPHLTTIAFGPGILTTACFETCLNFLSLRHLELKEVKISIDFKLVIAIGTLPELDTFVLDDRIGYHERDDSDEEPLPNVGFLHLKKLHITGTLALLHLLCNATLGSEVLEDLGLTLVRRSAPSQCGLSGSHGKRKNKSLKGSSGWRVSRSSGETEIDSMTTNFFHLLKGLSRPSKSFA